MHLFVTMVPLEMVVWIVMVRSYGAYGTGVVLLMVLLMMVFVTTFTSVGRIAWTWTARSHGANTNWSWTESEGRSPAKETGTRARSTWTSWSVTWRTVATRSGPKLTNKTSTRYIHKGCVIRSKTGMVLLKFVYWIVVVVSESTWWSIVTVVFVMMGTVFTVEWARTTESRKAILKTGRWSVFYGVFNAS